jgi:hypothetical protein
MGYSDLQVRIFFPGPRPFTKPSLARRALGSDHPHNVGYFLILDQLPSSPIRAACGDRGRSRKKNSAALKPNAER